VGELRSLASYGTLTTVDNRADACLCVLCVIIVASVHSMVIQIIQLPLASMEVQTSPVQRGTYHTVTLA